MGERGHTVHVLAGEDRLAGVGRIAVVASNERWTTFVPVDAASFDGAAASKAMGRPVVHVWFDDDAGVSLHVHAGGALVGELSLHGDDAGVTDADRALLEDLEALGVLGPAERASLLERMADAADLSGWTMAHGLEQLLALPFYEPAPPDVSERELLALLPKTAKVIDLPASTKRAKRTKGAAKATRPLAPPKDSWSDREQATLDLHCEYWATVFSMNNWKLYNRYKKHLPADHRADVDQLCNAVAMGDDDLSDRVKAILARIWSCEDWDAVIRDPALVDGDDDVQSEWLARIAS